MVHDHQPTPNQSIQALFGEALRETSDLARKEFALFRTEMSENVRSLVIALVLLMAAMVFAVVTLLLLTEALVDWVSAMVDSEALGALIVAAVTAAVAIGLGLYARSKLSTSTLAPTRTVRSVQRDAEVVTERVQS